MANTDLNVIIDDNIPFIKGLLEPYARVRYLAAPDIDEQAVRHADAILIRTRTRCDKALLGNSRCKFIATATIGTDHIDAAYCHSRGITAVNAPGCNAPAVAQYVFGAIMQLINRPIAGYTLGIVGAGHVGSIVERWARALDMRVLVCDPPRCRAEGPENFSSLSDIARAADIVTLHTPLTHIGPDATYHLVDSTLLASLRRSPILINAARGEIVDTHALIDAIDRGYVSHTVIDCWEHEPLPDTALLQRADIATPHIAGYSLQGKIRASQMILDAFTSYFNLPHINVDAPTPAEPARAVTPTAIVAGYDPSADSNTLKADPQSFERLRNSYPLRNELPDCHID